MGDAARKLTAAEEAVLRRLRQIYEPLGNVVEERDKFGHVSIDGTVKQMDWPVIEDVLLATYRAVGPKRK